MDNGRATTRRAMDDVVAKYAELLSMAKSTDKRVERGTLSTLCEDTKRNFKLSGKFIVSKQLINHRLSTGRLGVQHRGVSSPLALPETVLKAIITSTAAVNHPLNVGTTLALMNNLVKDTKYEEHFTKLKVVRRMKASNPCKPLISTGWLRGFLKRNPDIQSKVGKKFAANRASHCHYTSLLAQCQS